MKKILIALSGIYLLLVGILFGFISVLGLTAPVPQNGPVLPASLKAFGAAVVFLLALWPVITGIGVILKKNWARISLLAMSFFTLFIGLLTLFVLLLQPPALQARPDFKAAQESLLGIFGVLLVFLPVFFLVFFSRKPVVELFKAGQEPKRPAGITFIAVIFFLAGIFSAVSVFVSYVDKMPLGNILISGIALKVYFAVGALIYIYVALGLLRLDKKAWITAILLKVVMFCWIVTNILMLTEPTLAELMSSASAKFGMDVSGNMSLAGYRINSAFGLLITAVILFYLVLKRDLFLSNNKQQ